MKATLTSKNAFGTERRMCFLCCSCRVGVSSSVFVLQSCLPPLAGGKHIKQMVILKDSIGEVPVNNKLLRLGLGYITVLECNVSQVMQHKGIAGFSIWHLPPGQSHVDSEGGD